MLYCDLLIDSNPIWYGMPCLSFIPLKSSSYLGLVGNLMFVDMQGIENPDYANLGTRFFLLYFPSETDPGNVSVPLQATPAQEIDIILGDQNCTISIYER